LSHWLGGARKVYFQIKNPNIGKILEGLAMEDVVIFGGHFVYFMTKRYILLPFGMFPPVFSILHREKSGQVDVNRTQLEFSALVGFTLNLSATRKCKRCHHALGSRRKERGEGEL
jgi:hypothetical protein